MRLSLTETEVGAVDPSGVSMPSSASKVTGPPPHVGWMVVATRRSPSCSDRANWFSSWPGTDPEAS